jgi:formylglycine-generating enzyme required for sulfatase activity
MLDIYPWCVATESRRAWQRAEWADMRLPSEAQSACATFHIADVNMKLWRGALLHQNGCSNATPFFVPPVSDSAGLSHMLGNVWCWPRDTIQSEPKSGCCAPDVGNQKLRVLKGISYLCAVSCRRSYRLAARFGYDQGCATGRIRFKCVSDRLRTKPRAAKLPGLATPRPAECQPPANR